MIKQIKNKSGFTLIEVILALVLLTVFMGAGVTLFLTITRGSRTNIDYARASFLANEGIEAAVAIRNSNYLNLQDGNHWLIKNQKYQFGTTSEVIDGVFERTINVMPVFRDADGNIAESGDLDIGTKKITSTINFPGSIVGTTRTVSLGSYLSDWTSSEAIHTLASDFASSNKTNIEVVASPAPPEGNGALQLESAFRSQSLLLSSDIGDHGNYVAIDGDYAYVATAKEQSGLTIVNLQDPAHLSISSQLNVSGKGNGIAVSQNIAAVAVESSNSGLAFVDISNPSAPRVLSRLNLGDAGKKVAIYGTTLFITVNNSKKGLFVVNISNPSAPVIIKSIDIGGAGRGIAIYQNRLFVGVFDDDGVVVFDISDPSNPQFKQKFSTGKGYATGITVDYPYVYMSIGNDESEIFIAKLETSGLLSFVAKKHLLGGNTNDIAKMGNVVILGTDDIGKGVMFIDVKNPLSPNLLEARDIDAKAIGVAAFPPYIAIATDTANKGFVILGSWNDGYETSGEYISDPIYIGSANPEYLSVEFNASIPPGSSLSVYVKSADSAEHLSSQEWAGPYVISPSAVALPSQPYFQYRAVFSGDSNSTPFLDALIINYLR